MLPRPEGSHSELGLPVVQHDRSLLFTMIDASTTFERS